MHVLQCRLTSSVPLEEVQYVSNRFSNRANLAASNQNVVDDSCWYLGGRVCVSGEKFGILRFIGPLHFVDDEQRVFCGVELDEPLGQHDGAVRGRRYFCTEPNRGIFAPIDRITFLGTGKGIYI